MAMHRLSLVVSGLLASCSVQASSCRGFSCCGAHTLDCMGLAHVAHGLSCPTACGIFQDHRLNLSPLHGKVDFHWGSPLKFFFFSTLLSDSFAVLGLSCTMWDLVP